MASFKNWTEYHQRLNLIFHAIVAITMLPFIWLYLEIDTDRRGAETDDPVVSVLFMLICLSLMGTARIYKKRQMPEVLKKTTLRDKLELYQKVLLLNYALLEGAALFSTIAFYLTANYLFVVAYIFILFVFSLDRPHLERTCRELYLTKSERDILANRDTISD